MVKRFAIAMASAWLFLGAITDTKAAGFHLGPLVGFEAYHRRAPEEADSIRFTFGANFRYEFNGPFLMPELAMLVSSGVDSFATQNSIEERLYRIRFGVIYDPFHFDSLLVGLRGGVQYGLGTAEYNTQSPPSTDHRDPRYWSVYLGFIVGVTPLAGFGVEDEVTAAYDTYFKAWVYQMTFGIPFN